MRVVQVYLDDRGGGPEHVRMLRAAVSDAVVWSEVRIPPSDLSRNPAGWARTIRRIVSTTARSTIVHAHGVRASAPALIAARLRGAPLVITVQGLHSIRRSRSRVVRLLNSWVLGGAAMVLCPGASDRDIIVHLRLAPVDRVRTIRVAFEAPAVTGRREARSRFGLPSDAVVFCWIGRMSVEKDPVTFVDAVLRARAPVTGLLVGDGPLMAHVRRAAGVAERLVVAGWLDDVGPAIGAADALVNTSTWEGLPHVPLEAGSAGRALILTDVPGNRDVAGVAPARLVPPGDPGAIAGVMEELAADPTALADLGTRAAEAINAHFTREHLREDVLRAYHHVGRR